MPNEPEKKTPTPPVPPKDAPKPAPGVTPTPATAAPKVPTQQEKAADGKGPAAPVGKAQPQAGTMKPDPAAKTPEAGKDAAKDDKAPAQGEKKPAQPDKAVDGAAPVASDGKAQPQAGTVKPDPAAKTQEAKKDVDGKEAAKDGKAPAQGEKKPDEGKAPVAPDGKAQPQTGAAKPDTTAKDDKAQGEKKPTEPDKPNEGKAPAQPEAPLGPAAMGPAGTSITKVLEDRLNPPSEKDKRDLPQPGKGETFSVKLHPGYLKPSKFNTFSVDKNSDDYEKRKQDRIDRYRERAEKARQESSDLSQQAHKMASAIPFGQPLMPDHSFYKRDVRYREKISNKQRQSIAASEKADYYEEKARAAENNHAISSDDPDAIAKLTERLEKLQKAQTRMKQLNAYYRKHGTCKGFHGINDKEAAEMDAGIESDYPGARCP